MFAYHTRHGLQICAIGLSDLELDKSITDTITAIQQLKNEDKKHIMTTIYALIRDAKARNTYA